MLLKRYLSEIQTLGHQTTFGVIRKLRKELCDAQFFSQQDIQRSFLKSEQHFLMKSTNYLGI
jgi:hypothetical protein